MFIFILHLGNSTLFTIRTQRVPSRMGCKDVCNNEVLPQAGPYLLLFLARQVAVGKDDFGTDGDQHEDDDPRARAEC